MDSLIEDKTGRFHFASLIRCTVERYDKKTDSWKGTGGGMLDKFIATPFGESVATNCVTEFLSGLLKKTRLVVMFGLGTKLNYFNSAFDLFSQCVSGNWEMINPVAYSNGHLTVVHVEHFASQGALIPNWLGENDHPRAELGLLSKAAVDRLQFRPL